MIKEKLDDLTFLYLYIREFKWNTTMETEVYMGHPRVGEVYRAALNKATGNYKLFLPIEGNHINTFVFNSLNVSSDQCSGKIEKISKSNIIQLNLREEQLNSILEWMDKDNIDVKKAIEPNKQNQDVAKNIARGLMSLREAIEEHGASDNEARRRADQKMANLYMTNTDLFEIVLEIVDELHDADMARLEYPHLMMALSEEGKGINVQQALIHLSDYMDSPKNGGDCRESILGAIMNLVSELERRTANQLD